jgi:hypothetical protein
MDKIISVNDVSGKTVYSTEVHNLSFTDSDIDNGVYDSFEKARETVLWRM